MALPKLEAPKYSAVLPSTGESIEYRPYLVKEEKMLLLAMESQDQKQIMNAVCDLIDVCTFNKVKARKLPIFDVEFLFLKLRAKSVGESTTLRMKCQSEECDALTDVEVNLDFVQVQMPEKINNKVEITESVGIVMKYPTLETVKMNPEANQFDTMMEVLIGCVDYIYDENDVYPAAESSKQELTDFIESLNSDQFKRVQQFFEDAPKVESDMNWKCVSCGHDNSLKIQGLQSFFE